jgi:DASH complex subunit Dam1
LTENIAKRELASPATAGLIASIELGADQMFHTMPNPTPHRTPLRRISQGSLFALSHSGAYPDAPHGLGFLEPAMAEFVDETEALQANLEGMKNLSDSLATFNESFASWLYIMNMNALTTDWPKVSRSISCWSDVDACCRRQPTRRFVWRKEELVSSFDGFVFRE